MSARFTAHMSPKPIPRKRWPAKQSATAAEPKKPTWRKKNQGSCRCHTAVGVPNKRVGLHDHGAHDAHQNPSSAVEGLDEASENHAFHRGPTLCEQWWCPRSRCARWQPGREPACLNSGQHPAAHHPGQAGWGKHRLDGQISFGTYEFQFFVRIPRKCRTSALRHVIRAENHAPPETTSDQLAHWRLNVVNLVGGPNRPSWLPKASKPSRPGSRTIRGRLCGCCARPGSSAGKSSSMAGSNKHPHC